MMELFHLLPELGHGAPLLIVRLDGEPQRSAFKCSCLGKVKPKPMARPDPGWRKWRDVMVVDIREAFLAEAAAEGIPWSWPITVPVIVGVTAVFTRPGRPSKPGRAWAKKTTFTLGKVERPYPFPWVPGRVPFVGTPDHDQVVKAAVDVCVQAGLLLDDPLVVGYRGGISRWYAAEGEDPHVEVRMWRAFL